MNERQSAYNVLLKIQKNTSYSNLALDAELSSFDGEKGKALVSRLVYGVLERQITLDYCLSLYLKEPIKKLKPEVLTALRLGAYQLLFTDKIPAFAAVNESVKIIRSSRFSFAAGLVNSVLRKVSENGLSYPETDDKIYDMSIRFSCPVQLVNHFVKSYGEENASGILASSFEAPPVTARVNTLKISADELMKKLSDEGIKSEKLNDAALNLIECGSVEKSECYRKGLFHIQDLSSQKCCEILGAEENETVIDVCSAPGGKAFTIAEMMKNKGRLLAFDLYEHRVNLIKSGKERLGLSIIETAVGDASKLNENMPKADRVLCDAPCSGLGVIRRKPEIRFKDLSGIDNLTQMQYNILTVSSSYVRSGGTLVYSTCTLNPNENEEVCDRFLKEHGDFSVDGKYLTFFPHINNSDGFFIARFSRE